MPKLLCVLALLFPGCGVPAGDGAEKPTLVAAGSGDVDAKPASAAARATEAEEAAGIDWPDFLGPRRNNKSPERGILTEWPAAGPPIVWKRRLGTSYGMGTVRDGTFFQFDRHGKRARLTALDAKTGKERWRFEYPTAYEDILGYNNGPRCSPVVDGDRVYVFGVEGMLYCVRADSGKPVWKIDTTAKYGVVQNFFGVGSTPIVEGDLLIVMVGGSPPNSPETYSGRVQGNGTGIVAFDKYTGEEKYRLSNELAGYASPVTATIGGRRWCFVFARGGLLGFEPKRGAIDFHFPWRSPKIESVNASTPLVIGDRVFITESYGPGGAMLKVKPGGVDVVWSDEKRGRSKSLMAHINTPIYHEGYLYACSGQHSPKAELRCIDANDGAVQWSTPGLRWSSLLYVDGHLVCLSEDGTLRLIRATPERYDLVAEAVLRDPEGGGQRLLASRAWAAPVLSHGLLYVRDEKHLVCLELVPGSR